MQEPITFWAVCDPDGNITNLPGAAEARRPYHPWREYREAGFELVRLTVTAVELCGLPLDKLKEQERE